MTEYTNPSRPPAALDDLVTQLLECGAVLSQLIAGMVEFDRSGRSAPDAAPIPVVAHELIRSALGDVRRRHSRRDIRVAAAIVAQATDAIAEDIIVVSPELLDELEGPST
jgi:hypothetical protein